MTPTKSPEGRARELFAQCNKSLGATYENKQIDKLTTLIQKADERDESIKAFSNSSQRCGELEKQIQQLKPLPLNSAKHSFALLENGLNNMSLSLYTNYGSNQDPTTGTHKRLTASSLKTNN